jgi:hypothetical protein
MTDAILELSPAAKAFKLGIYKHFKGDLYEALCVARDSQNCDEEYVVYRSLEKGITWIRPLKMFLEKVERSEYSGPRFVWVREKE